MTRHCADTGIAYDRRAGGILYLYRSPVSFANRVEEMTLLTDRGEDLRALDPDQVGAADPALESARTKLAGALHAVGDETGDCRQFTQALAAWCEARGVVVQYDTAVRRIDAAADRVEKVITDRGEEVADAYVMALGFASPWFAKPLGLSLPIYPIKGYSVTLPIAGRNHPPALNGIDEDKLCAYTRMGERLRVTATAEFAGYDKRHRPADFTPMREAMRDLLPGAADYTQPLYWAGLRPMTPDNCPYLGRAGQRNLWYNTGHGHIGWTMANGSARIVADLIKGENLPSASPAWGCSALVARNPHRAQCRESAGPGFNLLDGIIT